MSKLSGLTTNISQQPPTSPYPAIGCNQRPAFSLQLPHHQPVLQAQSQPTPPPDNSDNEVDLRDMSSIPNPGGLSKKTLRAEMQLDRTPKAKTYYNKIRVSTLIGTLYWLTRLSPSMLFAGTWASGTGWTGPTCQTIGRKYYSTR